MSGDDEGEARRYASPACLMGEVDPSYMGLDHVDVQAQRASILRWRKAERLRLIAARIEVPAEMRSRWTQRILARLDALPPDLEGKVVSFYWPLRGEPDLRPWLDVVLRRRATTALPVIVAKDAPLAFRTWRPGDKLVPGVWRIPEPEAGHDTIPDVVLAPVVGFDARRFRLGYGGGYFDRTLAAFAIKPRVVGVGYALAEIPTIYPLAHDISMDLFVTEEGVI